MENKYRRAEDFSNFYRYHIRHKYSLFGKKPTPQQLADMYSEYMKQVEYPGKWVMEHPRPWCIAIEGNIGAGKSTLLRKLRKKYDLPVFEEKVSSWKFLKRFYKSPSEYAFLFQLEVLFSFAEAHSCRQPHLMERSTSSGFLVFASLLRDQGTLTPEAYQLLEHIWAYYNKSPDLIIYLEKSPERCLGNIQARNRPGEESITLEYLESVESKYKEYLDFMALNKKVVRVSSSFYAEMAVRRFLEERGVLDTVKKRKRFLLF